MRDKFKTGRDACLLALACLLTAMLFPAAEADQSAAAGHGTFSSTTPGGTLPAGWENRPVTPKKKLTRYTLVDDGGVTVVQADAEESASALMHAGDVDLSRTPIANWRWKVEHGIAGAASNVADKEDAPARLVFIFDGDQQRLSFGERTEMELANTFADSALPYATLMYVWSDTAPVGSIIPNPHTKRVQMVIVAGSAADAGKWEGFRRNVVQDFQRAFHEKPGPLKAYGFLTDTDNTGSSTRAWYGDIAFLPANR